MPHIPLVPHDYNPFTDYRPSCQIIADITKQNNIKNSYEMKQFLVHNATQLRKMNRTFQEGTTSRLGKFFVDDSDQSQKYWQWYKENLLN